MKAYTKGLDVICMLKQMHHVYYEYNGNKYNLKELYKAIKHNKNGEVSASIKCTILKGEEKQLVKIVFLRTNQGKNWIALLSTNTELEDEEIIRIYGKRWNIEVMFKTSKHFLHLDTEAQGRSFESVYAQTTIVFLRYIMLAYEARNSQDLKTCGDLLFYVCDEMKDISFLESLMILLKCFCAAVKKQLVLTENQINEMIYIFINQIPHCLRINLNY